MTAALLDTHAFLWWILDDKRLSATARRLIADPESTIIVSVVTAWEISIKAGLGRLEVPGPVEDFVAAQIGVNDFDVLPIQLAHALRAGTLPRHHGDPFDRLLVAQASIEQLPLVSGDTTLARYELELVW